MRKPLIKFAYKDKKGKSKCESMDIRNKNNLFPKRDKENYGSKAYTNICL